MPLRRDGADLIVHIRVKPGARSEGVGGLFSDAQGQNWLQASVTAPPDKGKANEALIARLAKRLAIPAKSILLETGAASRLKRLRILDCTPATETTLMDILNEEKRTG